MNTDKDGFVRLRRRRARRRKPEYQLSLLGDEPFRDPITRAWAREREARRWVRHLEEECWLEHLFQCVCCGKLRPDEKRREPESEVCLHCVAEAGLWN
jgi:hypothetical protein